MPAVRSLKKTLARKGNPFAEMEGLLKRARKIKGRKGVLPSKVGQATNVSKIDASVWWAKKYKSETSLRPRIRTHPAHQDVEMDETHVRIKSKFGKKKNTTQTPQTPNTQNHKPTKT